MPLGLGPHAGPAYVGKVGVGVVKDRTALGDAVNTASRILEQATAGEVVLSDHLYQDVAALYPLADQREVSLRRETGARQSPGAATLVNPITSELLPARGRGCKRAGPQSHVMSRCNGTGT